MQWCGAISGITFLTFISTTQMTLNVLQTSRVARSIIWKQTHQWLMYLDNLVLGYLQASWLPQLHLSLWSLVHWCRWFSWTVQQRTHSNTQHTESSSQLCHWPVWFNWLPLYTCQSGDISLDLIKLACFAVEISTKVLRKIQNHTFGKLGAGSTFMSSSFLLCTSSWSLFAAVSLL